MSTKARESKDISRAELIFIIASLRGILHSVSIGEKDLDWTDEEVKNIMEKTSFNTTQGTEDDVDWNEFSEKYL